MQARLWNIDQVAQHLGVSKSWIYKRTGPNAKLSPNIPTIPRLGTLRFDPAVIQALFSASITYRSLTTEKQQALKPASTERKRMRI